MWRSGEKTWVVWYKHQYTILTVESNLSIYKDVFLCAYLYLVIHLSPCPCICLFFLSVLSFFPSLLPHETLGYSRPFSRASLCWDAFQRVPVLSPCSVHYWPLSGQPLLSWGPLEVEAICLYIVLLTHALPGVTWRDEGVHPHTVSDIHIFIKNERNIHSTLYISSLVKLWAYVVLIHRSHAALSVHMLIIRHCLNSCGWYVIKWLVLDVLTAVVMKSSIFRDIMPCSPMKVSRNVPPETSDD
jgi:hypothetical protein